MNKELGYLWFKSQVERHYFNSRLVIILILGFILFMVARQSKSRACVYYVMYFKPNSSVRHVKATQDVNQQSRHEATAKTFWRHRGLVGGRDPWPRGTHADRMWSSLVKTMKLNELIWKIRAMTPGRWLCCRKAAECHRLSVEPELVHT